MDSKESFIKKAVINLRRAVTEVRRAQGNLNKADKHNMALLKLVTELNKQADKTESLISTSEPEGKPEADITNIAPEVKEETHEGVARS